MLAKLYSLYHDQISSMRCGYWVLDLQDLRFRLEELLDIDQLGQL